jgi:uncharacterized membrane protein
MEIDGLPLHALVIHAAVVFVPLAGLFAILFAVLPKWRYLTRWPTAALTLIALGSVWIARISGMALATDRQLDQLAAVQKHQDRGVQLSLLMILFAVVVAVAVWGLSGPSGFASGRGGQVARVATLDKVLPVVVVLAALLVLVWVFLTGDAGTRAVWLPTG